MNIIQWVLDRANETNPKAWAQQTNKNNILPQDSISQGMTHGNIATQHN